jgi:hypothetical protein
MTMYNVLSLCHNISYKNKSPYFFGRENKNSAKYVGVVGVKKEVEKNSIIKTKISSILLLTMFGPNER